MVVATPHSHHKAESVAVGSAGLGMGDPAAAKRYIKALVQTGNSAAEHTSYDEMEVLRQTASLGANELERLLGTIAEELQTELTGRVNEEFEGFVSLFKDIGAMGEEESVVLADKVALIRGLAYEAERTSRNDLNLLENVLNQYRENVVEQKRLGLARHLQADLERLETLLDNTWTDIGNVDADDISSDSGRGAILQLATEFFLKSRRLMIAASGKVELPGILLDRFAQLTASLYGSLDDLLLRALRMGKMVSFQEIAQVVIRIGKGATLTEAFASEFWERRLQKIINKERFEEMIRKGSLVERATEAMFGELTHAIKDVRNRWFVGLPLEGSVPSLFCHAALSPTFARLTKELPMLFSPALPDVFHSNFQTSCKFIEESCVQLLTPRELVHLNEDGPFQTYAKAWQLNVYFQLRFRDYAQALEETLARSTEASLALLERLCVEIMSEQVLLRPLIPKFHRLRLQCVARAARHWEERLQLRKESSEGIEGEQIPNMIFVKAHAQLVESIPKLIDLGPIEAILREVRAIERFKNLNERFHTQLRRSHEALVERYRALTKEACLQEISTWKGDEKEEEEEEGKKRSEESEPPMALALFFATCKGQQSEKQDSVHEYEQKLLDNAFRTSLFKEGISRFVLRANELLAQRRKAVANYKRLCSIMKDRRMSTSTLSSTASTPSTATEPGELADPEAQLNSLTVVVKKMTGRIRRLGEMLLVQTADLESQLGALSL